MGTAPNGPTQPNNSAQLLPMGAPVAVLSIPAIGLRTVILQGTTSSVLEDGPGHLRDTVMPGQAGVSVILGRQTAYGGPFGGLASLVPGDSIKVVTGQTVASYKVIDLRRAGDPLPPTLATGAGRMILVTADGAPLDPDRHPLRRRRRDVQAAAVPWRGAVRLPVADRERDGDRLGGLAADRAVGAAARARRLRA